MNQPDESKDSKSFASLLDEKHMLERLLSDTRARLQDVKQRISRWSFENWPVCSCCCVHKPANMMWIASQEEEDEYNDPNNEGYGGPVAGEYYCGC